ncbi:lysozyme inhibitor LprI family protein [Sulfuriferula thiophila]|uniref:lysozyme inhibitor LprI family protein n=1 Tax=Sulfuriferula thiophila TaxID=1781211 RepID=UPI0016790203|nr:lysozyme inhibitor LprI family protein [Sulfuriferula thiophila]
MRVTNLILFIFIAFVSTSTRAVDNCDANNLHNRDQYIDCMRKSYSKKLIELNLLYRNLQRTIPSKNIKTLIKNHESWLKRTDTQCALITAAFNEWGASYTPDSDFQYFGCRDVILEEQLTLYKSLVCPDVLETGEKADCDNLKTILHKLQK